MLETRRETHEVRVRPRNSALAVVVLSPSDHRAVALQSPAVKSARRDRDEIAVGLREVGLAVGIASPCYDRPVGLQPQCVLGARRDRDKSHIRRRNIQLAVSVTTPRRDRSVRLESETKPPTAGHCYEVLVGRRDCTLAKLVESKSHDRAVVSQGERPDFNSTVRRFHIDRCKAHLDFVYELEARNLLLVLGEYIWQQEVIKPEDQWGWAVESVRELGEHAATLGVEIAIELEPFHMSLVNNLQKMKQFLADVGQPAVRANLDISHLALAHIPAEEIRDLKGRIAHVHFSDCDGVKHADLPPGRGVVDFVPYLSQLKEVGFDGTVGIELEYSPEPEKIVEWVSEAYRETDRIMQSLNIRN